MAFYEDWAFWTALIAAIAIILSQIPPIHILLKKAKLEIELYSRIIITHKVGNPNLLCPLILSNVGGRNIRIIGITITIKRDEKIVGSLPGQIYFPDPNAKTSLLLTKFSLEPQEEWSHVVTFYNTFSRSQERIYKTAESTLRKDIDKKRNAMSDKTKVVDADSENVTPFFNIFDELFVWNPGEYEILVSVIINKKSSPIERQYRFTLFESDSEELISYKEDYKIGEGIYYDSGVHGGITVQVVENTL